jgi:hypothetical protein
MATFPTDEACKQFLMERRWPEGVKCPKCGNARVYTLRSRPFHWLCKLCKKYRFSVISGTIFQDTKYPLKIWFEVLWQIFNSKKGVSALQIQRQIGSGSYETAWYMCMRLRASMRDPDFRQLMGIVEIDEMFIDGKDKNRHWNKKSRVTGGIGSGKVGVIGAITREGNVVCQIIENSDTTTLNAFVRKAVSETVDLVATDEHSGNRFLKEYFPHEAVSHSQGEYVRGEVHTNNLESFWSLFKRGITGSFHYVRKKYLPLYLAEFQFRHNNRREADIFGKAVAGA